MNGEETLNKNDRLHHVVTLLRSRRSITLAFLQEETCASRATLMRDLAWLRDKLGHPIHWDHESQSYRWRPQPGASDSPQEVAGFWFKPSEVLALLTLQHLISEVQPGELLHRHIKPLEERLHSILQREGFADSFARLHKRVRIIGLGKREVPPNCFELAGMALVAHPQLAARQRWHEVDTPAGPVPALLPPGRSNRYTPRMDAIPSVGEHTEAILLELGYSREDIANMRAARAI